MNRFDMTAQQRRDAVHATLPELSRHKRAAATLLLDFDGGAWFEEEAFVEHLLVDDPDNDGIGIAFSRLTSMLGRELDRGGWVDSLGSAAAGVLWLAAQLAGGELGKLAGHADPATSATVVAAVSSAFNRSDPSAPEQDRQRS